MNKLYSALSLALLAALPAIAQPSLTAANFNPTVGQNVSYHNFTPTTFTPGAAGANATWNFASTPNQSTVNFSYVTSASTPYGASFPGANLAANITGSYEYLNANAGFLARQGVYAGGTTLYYSDDQKILTYPFTYNSTLSDNFATTFTSGGYTFNRTGTTTATADGYGTLILPWGTLTNVLRVRYTETFQDVWIGGTINYSSTNYAWYKPGTHYYLFTLSESISPGGTQRSGSYINQTMVGIDDQANTNNALNVYPNPVLEELTLELDVKQNSSAKIEIKNMLGQVVYEKDTEQLVSGTQKQMIDFSNLATGMYTVTVRSDDKNYIQKVIKK